MSGGMEAWLQARWYGLKPPPWWLILLSKIYAQLIGLRRRLYQIGLLRIVQLSVPVIVVGNVTIGGSGKTPMVIELVKRLQLAGYTPGVVSRGYGRSGSRPMNLHASTAANECGDEPLLIFQKTWIPVRVDVDRVAACRELVSQGCDIIVSDDGLQHLRMGRVLEIELVDGLRRYGNHHLLPAGPLREHPDQTNGVSRIRIASGATLDGIAHSMHLGVDTARNVLNGEKRALQTFKGSAVAAVAGIANPEKFFNSLRMQGLAAVEFGFPDHHRFTPLDLQDIPRPILMTEKDAVKCAEFADDGIWAVPLNVLIDESFFIEVFANLKPDRSEP